MQVQLTLVEAAVVVVLLVLMVGKVLVVKVLLL